MKHITIDGARIPALGYGTWQLSGEDCVRGVRTALDIGYRHIDTAQAYGNEAEVGRAIAESAVGRGDVFLTTKVWREDLAPEALRRSVEDSLRRLATDYVDLLLIHWPNDEVPLGDTLAAMRTLQDEGRVRHLGVSNFTVALMREAIEEHGVRIVNNQVEYHPTLSQRPVLDFVRDHDMFLTAYSPLARGGVPKDPTLAKIGERYGKTAAQVGLRWLVEQDRVAAIPRASGERHALANFEIFDFELSDDDRAEIDRMQGDDRKIDPAWAPRWDAA